MGILQADIFNTKHFNKIIILLNIPFDSCQVQPIVSVEQKKKLYFFQKSLKFVHILHVSKFL